MNPRLIFPFIEQKAIKSMQPNEDGINPNLSWNYRIFPKFNQSLFSIPRPVADYNKEPLNFIG